MQLYTDLYDQIASVDNLFSAWNEFHSDKQSKLDVMRYEWRLEENIFTLHRKLKDHTYLHGSYQAFYIQDPKQRIIHKAKVEDRVLHHALFIILNPIFEPTFIPHSYSCRIGKGTHRGVLALSSMLRKVSKNNTKPAYALKCDIQKFFASMGHFKLIEILEKRIGDEQTMALLRQIICSFDSKSYNHRGLPIGNLTSQLFANVYMNGFDQFMKHELKVKHYVRYTDDFVIVADNKEYLLTLLPYIAKFLDAELGLTLHPHKVSIRKFRQGIDFLGYIVLPHHILLRTKTKRRIIRKLDQRVAEYIKGTISDETFNQSLQSYLGVLQRADAYKITEQLKNSIWLELVKDDPNSLI